MAPGPASRLADRIRRLGPIPFSDFVDAALYDPDGGFYSRGRGAGRGRDFLTSPEVGPLFAAIAARAVDQWWDAMGRPDPFVVVEAGAGPGTLARDLLAAGPRCAPALRYALVERSAALRETHASVLQGVGVTVELPSFVLGPVLATADEDETEPGFAPRLPATGPLATSLGDLPADPFSGVILANELLDNMAFDLLERGPDGWLEVRVGLDDGSAEAFVEVPVPARPDLAAVADTRAPDARPGARLPVQDGAREWVRSALGLLRPGALVVIDYADESSALAARPWTQWVRTYRRHGRGGHPLERPGDQDITCEVAVDQVAAVRPTRHATQAEWLAGHGLDELAVAARAEWEARAAIGDLAALRARSRLAEAAALRDPAGLGAFHVLEWEVGVRPR